MYQWATKSFTMSHQILYNEPPNPLQWATISFTMSHQILYNEPPNSLQWATKSFTMSHQILYNEPPHHWRSHLSKYVQLRLSLGIVSQDCLPWFSLIYPYRHVIHFLKYSIFAYGFEFEETFAFAKNLWMSLIQRSQVSAASLTPGGSRIKIFIL